MKVSLATIDRPSVRRLAEEFARALRAAANTGRNAHQLALDQQDELAAFSATLSSEDALRLSVLYTEEMLALAARTNEETAATLARTAELQSRAFEEKMQKNLNTASTNMRAAQIISLVLAILFFVWLFKR